MDFPVEVRENAQAWTNVTLPYSVWHGAATEINTLQTLYVPRLKMQIIAVILSTLLQGVYTLFTAIAAKAIIKRGFKGTPRNLLILTTTMYVAAAVYWIAVIAGICQTYAKVGKSVIDLDTWLTGQTDKVICVFAPANNEGSIREACRQDFPAQTSANLDVVQDCIGTASLTVNVILGDSIVWWRVWALWGKNRYVLLVWCGMVLATLVLGTYDTVSSCTGSLPTTALWGPFGGSFRDGLVSNFYPAPGGSLFTASVEGFIVICLSFSSNAIATILVGYLTWQHRGTMKKAFSSKAGNVATTRVGQVLLLLFESGIAYCILWLFLLISQSFYFQSGQPSIVSIGFIDGCLVPLVGMYPTIIILIVTLNKSEWDRQQQFSAGPVPTPPAIRLASIHNSTATDASTRQRMLSSFIGLPSLHFSEASRLVDEEETYHA